MAKQMFYFVIILCTIDIAFSKVNFTCIDGNSTLGNYCYYQQLISPPTLVFTTLVPFHFSFKFAYDFCARLNSTLPQYRDTDQYYVFDNAFNQPPKPNGPQYFLAYIETKPKIDIVSIYDGDRRVFAPPKSYADSFYPYHAAEPSGDGGCIQYVNGYYTPGDYFCQATYAWYNYNYSITCQQKESYDSNMVKTDCAPLCLSKLAGDNYRLTTSPELCNNLSIMNIPAVLSHDETTFLSKNPGYILNSSIGYTLSVFVPGVSAPIYEMYSPNNNSTKMVFGTDELRLAESNGYNISSMFFVITYPVVNTLVQYSMIYGNNSYGYETSLIVPYNGSDYYKLINSGLWYEKNTFYLFPAMDSDKMCHFTDDCEWNEWEPWSNCSAACGDGQQMMVRTKKLVERNNGTCESSNVTYIPCNLRHCLCTWSKWSEWSDCTENCTHNARGRNRTIFVEGAGETCDYIFEQEENCSSACMCLAEWSTWTACSKTCGIGSQSSSRNPLNIDVPNNICPSTETVSRQCNNISCPCQFGQWSTWTRCSATCNGQGYKLRSKTIINPDITECSLNISDSQVCFADNSCPEGAKNVWPLWACFLAGFLPLFLILLTCIIWVVWKFKQEETGTIEQSGGNVY